MSPFALSAICLETGLHLPAALHTYCSDNIIFTAVLLSAQATTQGTADLNQPDGKYISYTYAR